MLFLLVIGYAHEYDEANGGFLWLRQHGNMYKEKFCVDNPIKLCQHRMLHLNTCPMPSKGKKPMQKNGKRQSMLFLLVIGYDHEYNEANRGFLWLRRHGNMYKDKFRVDYLIKLCQHRMPHCPCVSNAVDRKETGGEKRKRNSTYVSFGMP